jgi:hypothetical protein
MGQTPDDIKRQMSDTRSSIENTVGALQTATAAAATDVSTRVAESVSALGDTASNATIAAVNAVPKLENPIPLLVGAALAGFAIGFAAPISAFERKRLQPLGDEIVRRVQNARQEVTKQSRAVVDETLSAAKSSASKHGKEAAEHLGV